MSTCSNLLLPLSLPTNSLSTKSSLIHFTRPPPSPLSLSLSLSRFFSQFPNMASKVEGEPLQFKTYVLKVSIHCEGCKKKVSRILKNVSGVYEIKIDSQQNKVTVTGNVEAETLIRKLHRSGKHAELWPIEKRPSNNPNPKPNNPNNNDNDNKGKNKEMEKDADKDKDASKSNEPNKTPEKKTEKSAATNSETDTKPAAAEPAPVTTEKAAADAGSKRTETDTKSGTGVSETSNKEASASKSDPKPEKPPTPDTETKPADTATNGGGSGGNGKKKGKQEAESDAGNEGFVMNSDGAPPLHHQQPTAAYQVPPQPQPVYAASYNMVYPTASYSYQAPVPPTPQSYMYSGHLPPEYYPQYPPQYPHYHHDNYYGPMGPMEPAPASSSQSQGSYDFFSDENANSCSVM